ncbi:hypothetical protein A0J61_04320 [Choanephora cucurbitarum]|uniref:Uncharacterized protein n=1 Tax=Choanephora cucurbitarum TaxID=101091 RepID=A0A1C7NF94_9FUNG|nr:hypothetical protein A0J61_04320 [Choanephora cucurbitarum]
MLVPRILNQKGQPDKPKGLPVYILTFCPLFRYPNAIELLRHGFKANDIASKNTTIAKLALIGLQLRLQLFIDIDFNWLQCSIVRYFATLYF